MQKSTMSGVILLLAAAAVEASTVAPLNLKELSTLARRVVIGRVERLTSYQDASSGRILSRVQIAETHWVEGSSPVSSLSFEMTGGTFGGRRQWISGFPSLEVGDRVVLFLADETSTPLGPTVGLWQGVFFIEPDADGGRDTIADHRRRPLAAIRGEQLVAVEATADTSARSATRPVVAAPAPRLSLDEFITRVSAWRAAGRRDTTPRKQ